MRNYKIIFTKGCPVAEKLEKLFEQLDEVLEAKERIVKEIKELANDSYTSHFVDRYCEEFIDDEETEEDDDV